MANTYTAITKQDADWWIGWIEEVPGVNCQERTREELLTSLRVTLKEAMDFDPPGGTYDHSPVARPRESAWTTCRRPRCGLRPSFSITSTGPPAGTPPPSCSRFPVYRGRRSAAGQIKRGRFTDWRKVRKGL